MKKYALGSSEEIYIKHSECTCSHTTWSGISNLAQHCGRIRAFQFRELLFWSLCTFKNGMLQNDPSTGVTRHPSLLIKPNTQALSYKLGTPTTGGLLDHFQAVALFHSDKLLTLLIEKHSSKSVKNGFASVDGTSPRDRGGGGANIDAAKELSLSELRDVTERASPPHVLAPDARPVAAALPRLK